MTCAIYQLAGISPGQRSRDNRRGKRRLAMEIGEGQIGELTFAAASAGVQSLRHHERNIESTCGLVLERYARAYARAILGNREISCHKG